MSSRNLLSKEWCNLIFEGRNKDYGAYLIRQNMGKRYFVALSSVFLTVGVFVAVLVGLKWWMVHSMEQVFNDWEKEIPKLKMAEVEPGHTLRMVAGSRPRPRLAQVEKASSLVPEIVDVVEKEDIRFGVEEPVEEVMEEGPDIEWQESIEELDSVYDEKNVNLPIGGTPLQPTEVVEEMPQFPGGIPALMKWLDENVVYPARCVRMKIGGELQVTFLVDIDGTLHEPEITYSLHPDLDRSVLNAIRRMPRWIPGRVDGKLSVVSVTLPVHFRPR